MKVRPLNWLSTGLLLGWLIAAAPAATGGEAKDVFRKISPSVVLVRDLEGFGSGVVLTADGLILTNLHVVNTPLPLEVCAEVNEGGRQVTRQFKNVKIVGVHSTYDAALIRVTAPGVQFIPTAPAGPDVRIETGDNCYVIGNPGGLEGQTLRNTITTGVVGAAEREMEGLSYIQVSAAINPGNSGGALCDSNGRFIGVVTFKISEKEGIGFAIPTGRLKDADFKPLSQRKDDIKKCIEYENIGTKYYKLSQTLANAEEKARAQVLAFICFRLCLAEAPNQSSPYHNIAIVYMDVARPDLAKPFFERALELDPNDTDSLRELGIIAVKKGDEATAQAFWRRGLECPRNGEVYVQGAAACAENLAISMANGKKFGPAAYFAAWANSIWRNPTRQAVINSILGDSRKHLDAGTFAQISAKKTGFSFDELYRAFGVKIEATVPQSKPEPQPESKPETPPQVQLRPEPKSAPPPPPPPPPPPQAPKSEAEQMADQCQRWFNMAANYERSGMKPQAREYLQKIIDRYPGSTYAKRAAEQMQALGD